MNKYAQELRDKYSAEEVCGSLIANVNGKRQIIAFYDSTKCQLTPWGERLEQQTTVQDDGSEVLASVEPAKKRGRPRKGIEQPVDDVPVTLDMFQE